MGNHIGISRESCSFLGFANYYNRLIPDFAKVAAPISSLLSNQKEFKWATDYQCAFDTLK